MNMKPEEVMSRINSIPGMTEVEAVKKDGVYLLYNQAENIFVKSGPWAVELLAKTLYPEVFGVEVPQSIEDDYVE